MSLLSNLDRNNLHHAYLIEGNREDIIPELLKFIESIGVSIVNNPDFSHMALDSFKMEDARNLKSFANEKSSTENKKIYIISANTFLHEAQNSMLKMFEEPIENTHFFVITRDTNSLLKTFISRFYLISPMSNIGEDVGVAEAFIKLPLQKRIDFIKELLIEEDDEDEDGNEIIVINSTRAKAMRFINALEKVLHTRFITQKINMHGVFNQIFKVREYLRMPGSSPKTLLESVALVVPNFPN